MRALLRLSAGLIVWAVAFGAIYALHGIGCARGWPDHTILGLDLQRTMLAGVWMMFLATALAVAAWLSRSRAAPTDRIARATGWIGVAATIVTFLPILAIPVCR